MNLASADKLQEVTSTSTSPLPPPAYRCQQKCISTTTTLIKSISPQISLLNRGVYLIIIRNSPSVAVLVCAYLMVINFWVHSFLLQRLLRSYRSIPASVADVSLLWWFVRKPRELWKQVREVGSSHLLLNRNVIVYAWFMINCTTARDGPIAHALCNASHG